MNQPKKPSVIRPIDYMPLSSVKESNAVTPFMEQVFNDEIKTPLPAKVEDLEPYLDVTNLPVDNPYAIRKTAFNNQSNSDVFFKSAPWIFNGRLAKGMMISLAGSGGRLYELFSQMTDSETRDFNNSLIEWSEKQLQELDADIFENPDNEGVDWDSYAFWTKATNQLGYSVTAFALESMALGGIGKLVTAPLQLAARGTRAAQLTNSLINRGLQTSTALILSADESMTVAKDVYDQIMLTLPEDATPEQKQAMQEKAAGIGLEVLLGSTAVLTALNFTGAAFATHSLDDAARLAKFKKMNPGLDFKGKTRTQIREMLLEVEKNGLKNIKYPNWMSGKSLLLEGLQEAAEEDANVVAERIGLVKAGILDEETFMQSVIRGTFSEEGALSMILGAAGGIGQTALGNLFARVNPDEPLFKKTPGGFGRGSLNLTWGRKANKNIYQEIYRQNVGKFVEDMKVYNDTMMALDDAYNIADLTERKAKIEELQQRLFSLSARRFIENNHEELLKDDLRRLQNSDNTTLIDVTPMAEEIKNLQNTKVAIESQAQSLEGEEKQQAEAKIKEIDDRIARLKEDIKQKQGKTEAQYRGLATSKNDNAYKERIGRLIETIDVQKTIWDEVQSKPNARLLYDNKIKRHHLANSLISIEKELAAITAEEESNQQFIDKLLSENPQLSLIDVSENERKKVYLQKLKEQVKANIVKTDAEYKALLKKKPIEDRVIEEMVRLYNENFRLYNRYIQNDGKQFIVTKVLDKEIELTPYVGGYAFGDPVLVSKNDSLLQGQFIDKVEINENVTSEDIKKIEELLNHYYKLVVKNKHRIKLNDFKKIQKALNDARFASIPLKKGTVDTYFEILVSFLKQAEDLGDLKEMRAIIAEVLKNSHFISPEGHANLVKEYGKIQRGLFKVINGYADNILKYADNLKKRQDLRNVIVKMLLTPEQSKDYAKLLKEAQQLKKQIEEERKAFVDQEIKRLKEEKSSLIERQIEINNQLTNSDDDLSKILGENGVNLDQDLRDEYAKLEEDIKKIDNDIALLRRADLGAITAEGTKLSKEIEKLEAKIEKNYSDELQNELSEKRDQLEKIREEYIRQRDENRVKSDLEKQLIEQYDNKLKEIENFIQVSDASKTLAEFDTILNNLIESFKETAEKIKDSNIITADVRRKFVALIEDFIKKHEAVPSEIETTEGQLFIIGVLQAKDIFEHDLSSNKDHAAKIVKSVESYYKLTPKEKKELEGYLKNRNRKKLREFLEKTSPWQKQSVTQSKESKAIETALRQILIEFYKVTPDSNISTGIEDAILTVKGLVDNVEYDRLKDEGYKKHPSQLFLTTAGNHADAGNIITDDVSQQRFYAFNQLHDVSNYEFEVILHTPGDGYFTEEEVKELRRRGYTDEIIILRYVTKDDRRPVNLNGEVIEDTDTANSVWTTMETPNAYTKEGQWGAKVHQGKMTNEQFEAFLTNREQEYRKVYDAIVAKLKSSVFKKYISIVGKSNGIPNMTNELHDLSEYGLTNTRLEVSLNDTAYAAKGNVFMVDLDTGNRYPVRSKVFTPVQIDTIVELLKWFATNHATTRGTLTAEVIPGVRFIDALSSMIFLGNGTKISFEKTNDGKSFTGNILIKNEDDTYSAYNPLDSNEASAISVALSNMNYYVNNKLLEKKTFNEVTFVDGKFKSRPRNYIDFLMNEVLQSYVSTDPVSLTSARFFDIYVNLNATDISSIAGVTKEPKKQTSPASDSTPSTEEPSPEDIQTEQPSTENPKSDFIDVSSIDFSKPQTFAKSFKDALLTKLKYFEIQPEMFTVVAGKTEDAFYKDLYEGQSFYVKQTNGLNEDGSIIAIISPVGANDSIEVILQNPNKVEEVKENVTKQDDSEEDSNSELKQETPIVFGEEKELYTRKDNKGRIYTYYSITKKEDDGFMTTTFAFNRSDKDPNQRNTTGVPVDVALGNKYIIPAEAQNVEVYAVYEIRENNNGEAGATVMFRSKNDHTQKFKREVILKTNLTTKDQQSESVEQGQSKRKQRTGSDNLPFTKKVDKSPRTIDLSLGLDYKREDLFETIEWFKERFPSVPIDVSNRLTSIGAWGLFAHSAVTIADSAAEGTVYHEAWHVVSQLYLSPLQRKNLYNQYRRTHNVFSLSDNQIEERIADEFMDYMLGRPVETFTIKEQRSMFRRIFDFILELLDIRVNQKELFDNIKYNRLGNPRQTYSSNIFKKEMTDVAVRQDVIDMFMNKFAVHIFTDTIEGRRIVDHIVTDKFTKRQLGELFKRFIDEKYDEVLNLLEGVIEPVEKILTKNYSLSVEDIDITDDDHLQTLFKAVREFENSDLKYSLLSYLFSNLTIDDIARNPKHLETIYELLNTKNLLGDLLDSLDDNEFSRWLFTQLTNKFTVYGLQIADIGEELFPENNEESVGTDGKSNYWNETAITTDPKKSASRRIKLLLTTITDGFNSFRLDKTIDQAKAFAILLDELHSSSDTDDMMLKIQEMVKKPNRQEFRSLIEYLGNDDSLTTEQLLTRLELFDAIKKTSYDFKIYGIDSFGKVIENDSINRTKSNLLLSRWRSNFYSNTKYTKIINGQYVHDFVAIKKRFSLSGAQRDPIAFLGTLGFEFNNPQAVKMSITDSFIVNIYNELDKGNLTNIHERSQSPTSLIKLLVDAEINTTSEIFPASFLGLDGKSTYKYSLGSSLTQTVDELNRATEVDDLPVHLNSSVSLNAKYSVVLNPKYGVLFDNQGKRKRSKISISIISGLTKNRRSPEEYKKSSPSDYLQTLIYDMLQGRIHLPRTSDNKLERVVDFGEPIAISGYEAFKLYFEEELERMNHAYTTTEYAHNGLYEYYNNRLGKLYLFKELIENSNNPIAIKLKSQIDPNTGMILQNINALISELMNRESDLAELYEEFINPYIDETISLFRSTGMLNGNMNRGLPSNTDAQITIFSEDELRSYTREVVEKYFIGQMETSKMFYGHPRFFKSLDDMYKRASGAVGTKSKPDTSITIGKYLQERGYERARSNSLRVVTVSDVLQSQMSDYLSELSQYEGFEGTDAAAYISLPAYRALLFRLSRWDERLEMLYFSEMGNETIPDNTLYPHLKGQKVVVTPGKSYQMFKALKTQGFGPNNAETDYVPTFLKHALVPVLPSLARSDKFPLLKQLNDRMSDFDVLTFSTGVKVGMRINPEGKQSLFKIHDVPSDNTKVPVFLNDQLSYMEMPLEYFGIQVENVPIEKTKVPTGTQMLMHILSNLYSGGTANEMTFSNISLPEGIENGTSEATEWVVQEYIRLNGERLKKSVNSLINELGLETTEDGSLEYSKGLEKLVTRLKQEAIARDMPLAIVDELDYIVTHKVDGLKSSRRIESILMAMADQKAISIKRRGMQLTQTSSIFYDGFEQRPKMVNGKLVYVSEALKFYDKGSSMEIYAPHYFKELFGESIDIASVDPKLLQTIGFRIPTQGLNSIETIVIKDFLPSEAGDVVVVPAALVVKNGSDFDFDKLFLYTPNYYIKQGKPKYMIYEGTENELFEQWLFSVLSDKKLKSKYLRAEKIIDKDNLFDKLSREMYAVDLSKVQEINNYNKKHETSFTNYNDLLDHIEYRLLKGESTAQFDTFIYYDAYVNAVIEYGRKKGYSKSVLDKAVKFSDSKQNSQEYINELLDTFRSLPEDQKIPIGAIENRQYELMRAIMLAPENKENLLTPNSTDIFTDKKNGIITELRSIKDDVTGQFPMDIQGESRLFSLSYNTSIFKRYLDAKDAVGIGALHAKNHIYTTLMQLSFADMVVNGQHVKKKLRLKHNVDDDDRISFSGSLDADKKHSIFNVLSQILNGYVDAAKNPWIFDANAGTNNANAFIMLIRAGVPVRTVVYFMNQPIIRDYLNQREINESMMRSALVDKGVLKYVSRDALIDQIKAKYHNGPVKRKAVFTETELKEMFASEKLTSEQKMMQVDILDEFLQITSDAKMLSDFVKSTNYDTVGLSKSIGNVIVNSTYEQMVKESGAFVDVDRFYISPESSISAYRSNVDTVFQAISPLFNVVTIQETFDYFRSNVRHLIEFGQTSKIDTFSNKFIAQLKTYLAQNTYIQYNGKKVKVASLRGTLTKGNNSVAIRLQEAKKVYKDSLFIQSLTPIIREGEDATHGIILLKDFDTNVEFQQMTEDWERLYDIDPQLAVDIALVQMLQLGFQSFSTSMLSIMPSKLYFEVFGDIFQNAIDINEFNELFRRQAFNSNDSSIVRTDEKGFEFKKVRVKIGEVVNPDDAIKRGELPYTITYYRERNGKVETVEPLGTNNYRTNEVSLDFEGDNLKSSRTTQAPQIFKKVTMPEESRPEFDKLPSKSPTPTMTYAGIGSRNVPSYIYQEMSKVARELEQKGYTLNTGDASGSDTAFKNSTSNPNVFTANDATDQTRTIAKEIHPNPNALNEYALNLMARNIKQVFGENLDTPVDFVLFYAPESSNPLRPQGGTGQAVEMARRKGIPTINMADSNWRRQLDEVLAQKNITQAPQNVKPSILPVIKDNKINIHAGSGENAHLSNFAIRPFKGDLIFSVFGTDLIKGKAEPRFFKSFGIKNGFSISFQSVEQAFQAAKALFVEDKDTFTKIMYAGSDSSKVKALGQTVKMTPEQIKIWDEYSGRLMKEFIKDSFLQNSIAWANLAATKDIELTHTQDKSKWGTEFPKILMEVRQQLGTPKQKDTTQEQLNQTLDELEDQDCN